MARTGGPAQGVEYFGKDLEAMSFAVNYHRWIVAEFAPYLGSCVAEVGAGVGSFSELLLQSGVDRLQAFEPSANMFPVLDERLRHDLRARAINDVFRGRAGGEGFDTVVYVNVLEHIEDDVAELRLVREALRPDGHVLIFVPALPWLYSELDRSLGHFRRYTKGSLSAVVRQAGLSVVRLRYFDGVGILPWYVFFTLMKRGISGGDVALYDRWVVPVMRRVERLVAPPVGKNLLLVAKAAS